MSVEPVKRLAHPDVARVNRDPDRCPSIACSIVCGPGDLCSCAPCACPLCLDRTGRAQHGELVARAPRRPTLTLF